MTIVPPIKSQGIKTKLVDWIRNRTDSIQFEQWIEPFCGTGAVAFNIQPHSAILCDNNPHIISFYKAIQDGSITGGIVEAFLIEEGEKLLNSNGGYYYDVRERFNSTQSSLDFLFLNRACFNGMMRFNNKGGFNVPFCRKPNRFSRSLVTKIRNQVNVISRIISDGNYRFIHQDFIETIRSANDGDIIYCDPPYIDRSSDYFSPWSLDDEKRLHDELKRSGNNFIVSTWLKSRYRENVHIKTIWHEYKMETREHFYHLGGRESNWKPVTEGLIIHLTSGQCQ